MHLDLVEVLACPACGPPQGLVAMVEELSDRRLRRGHLGCPFCEAHYPIRGGILRLCAERMAGAVAAGAAESAHAVGAGGAAESAHAVGAAEVELLAALLDIGERPGWYLLDERATTLAPGLAELARAGEVVALCPDPGERAPTTVSNISGVEATRLPFLDGRLAGVAFGPPGAGREQGPAGECVREAVRALAPGARLVVLRPPAALHDILPDLALRVLAAEDRALVAERTAAIARDGGAV